jgi:penicillin-binding protein 2
LASRDYGAKPRGFLPRDPRVEEPYRLTPQMAFRIGILGALALAAFALLILRLWALQVLSGDDYLRAARDNQLRQVRVEATRGQILDRNGKVLVDNRTVTSIRIWPSNLPDRGRYAEMQRLAKVLDVPLAEVLTKLKQQKRDPLTPITIKDNVPAKVVTFLAERQSDYPGVKIEQTQVRRYPYGELAAQLLGNVGEITEQQLKDLKGYHLGDRVGQRGVELAFDQYLRGKNGLARARFDSAGHPRSDLQITQAATPGDAVRLTLDANLQHAAEKAIKFGEQLAYNNDNWYSHGGAAVAIDPRNGDILALASEPTFHPGAFVNPNRKAELGRLLTGNEDVAKAANYPMVNRAIAGRYPPGSTFKPVTALAAMEQGLISPYQVLDCPAQFTIKGADGQPIPGGIFNNWNGNSSGLLSLPQALEQSCDTYFYQVGYDFYKLPPSAGHPLQEWAARWGFGRPTGIDIGGEDSGLLPTPEWRKKTYSAEIDKLWKPGDSVQLAIGQKDLTVTPLQMARFYAMLANGGKLVRPHLLQQVEEPGTRRGQPLVLRKYVGPPQVDSHVTPDQLAAVQQGLYGATHGGTGTATAVFDGFPTAIAGKTGTAQKIVPDVNPVNPIDQSWFCGYGPADQGGIPTIAVCVVIENGGFGAEAAAPAALKIFQEYFHQKGGNALATEHAD